MYNCQYTIHCAGHCLKSRKMTFIFVGNNAHYAPWEGSAQTQLSHWIELRKRMQLNRLSETINMIQDIVKVRRWCLKGLNDTERS